MRSKVGISTGHSTVSRGAKAVNGHDEYLFNLDLVDEILKFNLPDAEWWRSDYNCEDIAYPEHLTTTVSNINDEGCECALEVHHNWIYQPTVRGMELIYWDTSQCGLLLARWIGKEFEKISDNVCVYPNLGRLGKNNAKYFWRATKCPAVIVEAGYLSNEDDTMWVQENRLLSAHAIRQGAVRWLTEI